MPKVNEFGFVACKKCNSLDVYPLTCFVNPIKYTAKCNYCKTEIDYYENQGKVVEEWNKLNT